MTNPTMPAPKINSRTPWGPAQSVEPTAHRSIFGVDTASHGGYKVTGTAWRNMQRDFKALAMLADGPGWFEEDCAAAAVIVCFPELARDAAHLERAHRALWDWSPDQYAAHFPPRPPQDSRALRQRAFATLTRTHFVVQSACGPGPAANYRTLVQHGFVGVTARRASDGALRYALIPKAEYDARGEFGFVVTDKHPHWEAADA